MRSLPCKITRHSSRGERRQAKKTAARKSRRAARLNPGTAPRRLYVNGYAD